MTSCYGRRDEAIRRPSATPTGSGRYVPSVIRQCSRTGCAAPARVTLEYHYGQRVVWLDDLHEDRDPHHYDLCQRHADRLRVPSGWRLEDRRIAPTRLAS